MRVDEATGATIHNPLGAEPAVLDVVAVAPAGDGLVLLHTVQGIIGPVASDWPATLYTAEDAEFEQFMILIAVMEDL